MIINGFRRVLNDYNKTHKHLSLRAVGRITGASTYSITALYDGKANGIKFDVLNKLVKFFNVPVTDLINYQSGIINFYLNDGNKFFKSHSDLSDLFRSLNSKQKELLIHYLNKSIVLVSKSGFLIITVKGIHHHKYDMDILNIFQNITSVLSKPLEYADISPNDNYIKAHRFIDVQMMTKSSENKDSHFINIFNKLSNKLKTYIWTRALLHSGSLRFNEKSFEYTFSNDNYIHDVDASGYLPSIEPSKLVQWQHKYKNKNSYPLKAKSGDYKVNLNDYTTNNFKD